MIDCPQNCVQLGFDAVRCFAAGDNGLHHGVRVLAERRVGQRFNQPADAEHVAPQAGRAWRFKHRLADFGHFIIVTVLHHSTYGIE
jgi:hypothetical protein